MTIIALPPIPPPAVLILPLREAPTAESLCACERSSLLAHVRGRWVHMDRCTECVGTNEPCWTDEPHTGCADPEPVTCTHEADWRCQEPVSLETPCAYVRGNRSCCGCCWDDNDMGNDDPPWLR